MEHIDCNTWIVMLRFTVVPLTGFEAFGVVTLRAGDLDIHVNTSETDCQTDQSGYRLGDRRD
jgi:hypothetical protein